MPLGNMSLDNDTRTQRVAQMCATSGGWMALLQTLSEHPGMSARNAATIAEWRVRNNHAGFLDVISFEDAQRPYAALTEEGEVVERRGSVRQGEKALFMLIKREEDANGAARFRKVAYFSPSQCTGLNKNRFKGRALCASTSDEHMMLFCTAAQDVDLEGLDEYASYVIGLRYGFGIDAVPVPDAPAPTDAAELADQIDALSKQVQKVAARIDAGLSRIRAERAAALEAQAVSAAGIAASRRSAGPNTFLSDARNARKRGSGTPTDTPVLAT